MVLKAVMWVMGIFIGLLFVRGLVWVLVYVHVVFRPGGMGVCKWLCGSLYVIGGRWSWLEVGFLKYINIFGVSLVFVFKFLMCHYVDACGGLLFEARLFC